MKILMTGKGGKAGSWACRGEQLGVALGAAVCPMAGPVALASCDVAVVVKRVPAPLLASLRASGRPWVYDIVDAYKQPDASAWIRDEAIQWARRHIAELRPDAVIWPTRKMREDCDTGLPGLVLPHHHRPRIRNNLIRAEVKTVGYEGGPHYLADWEPVLEKECARRGWTFVINPEHLADLDIVVALRGGQWNGYVQENYKSNIKLANAHGSGTPFIGQMEQGYLETATGCEYWARDHKSIATCFDWLEDQGAREQIHDRFQKAAYPVERAASELSEFLHGL